MCENAESHPQVQGFTPLKVILIKNKLYIFTEEVYNQPQLSPFSQCTERTSGSGTKQGCNFSAKGAETASTFHLVDSLQKISSLNHIL